MAEKFASLELSQKVSQQFAQMVKIIRHKKVDNPLLVAFKSRILLIKIFLRSTNGKVKIENINFWIWGYIFLNSKKYIWKCFESTFRWKKGLQLPGELLWRSNLKRAEMQTQTCWWGYFAKKIYFVATSFVTTWSWIV